MCSSDLNYIIAKQKHEKFLIRVEDTDFERNIEGKEKEILSILNLFGMFWDDLVYQSENFDRHKQMAEYLLSRGDAFYCYCTKEFLDDKRAEAETKNIAFRYRDEWADILKEKNPKPTIRVRGADRDISYMDKIKGKLCFSKDEDRKSVV